MTPDRILVVDTDSKCIHLLRQILTSAGYKVSAANNLDKAIQLAAVESPAIVITEAALADGNTGCMLIKRIQEFSNIPVMVLSAAGEVETVLLAYEAGAEDYLIKPFDARILLARIKVIQNRCTGKPSAQTEIVCQDLVIHPISRQVSMNGQPVYLTETEYNLLLEMARHPDQVMTHEQLLQAVWGPQYLQETDYLRSFVHILRRKLECSPSHPRLILSRSGVGYVLVSTSSGADGR